MSWNPYSAARQAAGLTQAELAARLGRSRPSIAMMEAGRQAVDAYDLARWAEATGEPIAALVDVPTPAAVAVPGPRVRLSFSAQRDCPRPSLCFGMICVAPRICRDPAVRANRTQWAARLARVAGGG